MGGDDEMLSHFLGHMLPPGARVLVLCGDSTSPQVADRLAVQGFRVERHAIYRSVPTQDHVFASVTGALDRVGAIVVHSQSGAERIVPLLRDAHWRGSLWCISEQAARACGDLNHVRVHTAALPSEGALLDMIARLLPARRTSPSGALGLNAAMLLSALRPRPSSRRLAARNDNAPVAWRTDDDPDPSAA